MPERASGARHGGANRLETGTRDARRRPEIALAVRAPVDNRRCP
jgi:hypothetical protein